MCDALHIDHRFKILSGHTKIERYPQKKNENLKERIPMAIIQKNVTKENKLSIDERISKLLNNNVLNSIEDLLKILPAKDELSQEDLFTMVY